MIHRRSGRARYAEALAAALAALAVSWVLRNELTNTRLLLFWVMSSAVAWRGGTGPAMLAAITAITVWQLVLSPLAHGRLGLSAASEWFTVAVYLGVTYVLGHTVDSFRRARARVLQATDGMIDAMLVYDEEWRLRFINDAGRKVLSRLGLDADALLGRVIWEEVPVVVGTPFETETRRAQREERIIEYEARYPDADMWLHVRCVPAADGVTLFAHDVTAAQRAEYDRRRMEERYRALVEASTVMVWTADPGGAVTDLPVWREITGQSTEEVRGSGWIEAVHPADRESVRSAWLAAVRAGHPYFAEYRLLHRDGGYHWYRSRGVPVRDGDEIVEWVGVFDDINDERLARDRHAAVDNALGVLGVSLDYEWNLAAVTRLLVPTLADYCAVDLLDAAGELQRVSCTHVDPEKEELLRALWTKYPYGRDDPGAPAVVRTGTSRVIPRIDRDEIIRFARTSEQGEMLLTLNARSYVCVPMSSRGQTFGALSLVYSDSGRVYGPAEVAAVEQIAARAATAIENARLYAEARSANRAKSDFLATMSHELRTPLNAIAGYTELLSIGVRGVVNEEQRRDLLRIRQNQQHLLEIINDILNFARIEAGRMQYDLRVFPVRGVLERMEGAIEPQARARSITYEYRAPSDDVQVVADREKLEQVLINLLGNAVKFTPPGGRVSLSAECAGTGVRILVSDTGVGIPRDRLSSIFEPFVQVESAFTRTAEGTGLGLAISRQLARGMGGDLVAVSEPGTGSTFIVELPGAVRD